MQNKADMTERRRFIPRARGVVLEVGIGSGINVPFYGPEVRRLYGVDPSRELWRLARKRVSSFRVPIDFVASSAESIPLPEARVDDVVITWSLCSIPDPMQALGEMRRVLKPGGRLIFVEHGQSPDPAVRAWQERLNPVWRRIAGGCNLNRKMDELLAKGGFHVSEIEQAYSSGPKPFTYLYKGVAQRDR
jgi:ubiquinone/menaquinone biosynthesis C-methylase UbiE